MSKTPGGVYVASDGTIIDTVFELTPEEVEEKAREIDRLINQPVPAALLTRNWLNKTKDPIGFSVDDEGSDE
ncbi:MAG: hypothetical protein Tsb0016_07360 [Sphingomonadales bacterium]